MIGLYGLGNPYNCLSVLDASEVSQDLPQVAVVRPAKLVFYNYPMLAITLLVRHARKDIGPERPDPVFNCLYL